MNLIDELPANASEDMEQMAFVQWFRRTYSGVLIYHIPNGGKRGKSEAARFKAMGVVAGVPDLFIPAWAMYIEMKKAKGGKVSPEQEAMHIYLRERAYKVIVAQGAIEVRDKVIAHSDAN